MNSDEGWFSVRRAACRRGGGSTSKLADGAPADLEQPKSASAGRPEGEGEGDAAAAVAGGRGGAAGGRWWQVGPDIFRDVGPVLRRYPAAWVLPLLVTLVLAAAGTVGVIMAANDVVSAELRAAQGFADNAAVSIGSHMEVLGTAPLLALASFIQQSPRYESVHEWFQPVAAKMALQMPNGSMVTLNVAPRGVLTHFYPEATNKAAIGLDLLNSPTNRAAAIETIRRRQLVMQGPFDLVQGYSGIIFRVPIFMPNVERNETFGGPAGPLNCTVCSSPGGCRDVCYDPETRSKFWGFASVVVNIEDLKDRHGPRLGHLSADLGYNYRLVAPQPGAANNYSDVDANDGAVVVAETPRSPVAPVTVTIPLPRGLNPDLSWRLMVAPDRGWVPSWRAPMLAVVSVVSVLIGVLAFAIMVNRRQLVWAVDELQATIKELAEEKLRTDALLVRQYDLICCAMDHRRRHEGGGGVGGDDGGDGAEDGGGEEEGPGGVGGGAAAGAAARAGRRRLPSGCREGSRRSSGRESGTAGAQETALEQIEDMRRSLVASQGQVHPGVEDLQLLEMIGEGGFGRVWKGLWRGSEVAVKVMVLSSKMSGAEKRERMAIMEAAISSAMQHPNILQTFTYTLRTVSDSYATPSTTDGGASTVDGSVGSGGRNLLSSCTNHTHNFEVSLVLEYCHLGSLRDALDSGAFKLDDGSVNYAAVLDTAVDVARAMVHLHKQQVIHSDLKASNILLKEEGKVGRGAVAKVADFGLSVRIDLDATHVSEFQGTMSHMSPETQLHRRVTKASDVYSFGITLWELYTGAKAYRRVPKVLLSHQVCVEGRRPECPPCTPPEFRALVAACWDQDPQRRPTFESLLSSLTALRQALGGETPPLRRYQRGGATLVGGGGVGGGGGAATAPEGKRWRRRRPEPALPQAVERCEAPAPRAGAGPKAGVAGPPSLSAAAMAGGGAFVDVEAGAVAAAAAAAGSMTCNGSLSRAIVPLTGRQMAAWCPAGGAGGGGEGPWRGGAPAGGGGDVEQGWGA